MSDEAKPTDSGIAIAIKPYALDRIVDEAAHRIAEQLSATVEKMVEKRLDTILDEAWRASIATKAQAAIDDYLTKPRQRTNTFGEPMGQAEAFSDRIPKVVEEYMAQRVEHHGSGTLGPIKPEGAARGQG